MVNLEPTASCNKNTRLYIYSYGLMMFYLILMVRVVDI